MGFFDGLIEGFSSTYKSNLDSGGGIFNKDLASLGLNPTAFKLDSSGQQSKAPSQSPDFVNGMATSLAPSQASQSSEEPSSFFGGLIDKFKQVREEKGPTIAEQNLPQIKSKESWKPSGGSPDVGSNPFQLASKYVGLSEGRDAATLGSFFKKALGQNVDPRNTAWCAAFVNAVERSQGRPGTGSLMAKSFLKYGTPVETPTQGDIAILSRGGRNAPTGHVAFFDSMVEKGGKTFVRLLGGNQGNQVSMKLYPISQVLGFRAVPTSKSELDATTSGEFHFKGLGGL